jgi:CBS domain containing-hemolysin-like protein
MDPDPDLYLLLVVFLSSILLSAFFSGVETAFISANKLKIELERKKGFAPSAIISFFTKNPAQFVTTMILGYIVSLVIFVFSVNAIFDRLIHTIHPMNSIISMASKVILSVVLILFLTRLMPWTLFRNNPNKLLTVCVLPISIFYLIFYPVAKLLVLISRLAALLGNKTKHNKNHSGVLLFDKSGFDSYVEDANKRKQHAHEDERNLKILANALDFAEIKIRECIVPRTELVAVSVNDTLEHLRQKFSSSGNSKILVYDGSIDNIIGYIHHSKLFEIPVSSIRRMTKEAPIVPATMGAQKLLSIFIRTNKNLAVVVDEFGGTAGIVTIEDIMEEIFGEIEDEHDKIGLVDKRISEFEFEFSGRLEIDNINERYGLTIETSDEYETIAGLLLHKKGSIPKLNEIIAFDNIQCTIIEVSPTRIERIRLKLNGETN